MSLAIDNCLFLRTCLANVVTDIASTVIEDSAPIDALSKSPIISSTGLMTTPPPIPVIAPANVQIRAILKYINAVIIPI